MFALIQDGRVHQIVAERPSVQIDGRDVAIGPELIDVSGITGIAERWLAHPDGTFSAPPEDGVDLAAYAAAKRYAVENGGIKVNGIAIATDDRSKIMLIGARLKAQANPAFTTAWKDDTGVFRPLDAAEIIAVSDAVLAHVDASFAKLSAVLPKIAAGAITTPAGVDAAFAAA